MVYFFIIDSFRMLGFGRAHALSAHGRYVSGLAICPATTLRMCLASKPPLHIAHAKRNKQGLRRG